MKKVEKLELDCESSKNLVNNQHVRIQNNYSMFSFSFQFVSGGMSGIPNSKLDHFFLGSSKLDHSVCSKKYAINCPKKNCPKKNLGRRVQILGFLILIVIVRCDLFIFYFLKLINLSFMINSPYIQSNLLHILMVRELSG